LLTIGLVILLWRVESRRWVRWLGVAGLAAVILQGVLGGLTVLFMLPAPISIGHAGLAPLFFAVTIAIALVTSPGWRHRSREAIDDRVMRRVALAFVAVVYLQILLGATMRHLGAGLAIPTFPLAYGQLLPPAWPLPVAIHFAHRVGALVVAVLAVTIAAMVRRRVDRRPGLARPAGLLLILVALQITLGALVVLGGRPPVINTLHVATGALVFGTAVVIALRALRVRFE
jgi:cytochrome c oxidase assembly protein subunit 15